MAAIRNQHHIRSLTAFFLYAGCFLVWHYLKNRATLCTTPALKPDMAMNEPRNEIHVGAQGCLVIPAHLRKALNLKPGDCFIVRRVGESLVPERRETIEKRLWEMFAHIPKDVSLVDDLLAERRAEARREEDE